MENQPPNNIERILSYVQTGSPLRQVYLIDALLKVSGAIVEHSEEVRENMKNSPINPDAWLECAQAALDHWKDLR